MHVKGRRSWLHVLLSIALILSQLLSPLVVVASSAVPSSSTGEGVQPKAIPLSPVSRAQPSSRRSTSSAMSLAPKMLNRVPTPATTRGDAFLWYMEANPRQAGPDTKIDTPAQNSVSWLLMGEPNVDDKALFDASFSQLMRASMTTPVPARPSRRLSQEAEIARTITGARLAATSWNTNLVLNGTFSAGRTNWQEENVNSDAQALVASHTFPIPGCSGPVAQGELLKKNISGLVARLVQIRDLSDIAKSIDTGRVPFEFQLSLGGYERDNDRSQVSVIFLDENNQEIAGGTYSIWGPLAADRSEVTKCMAYSTNANIPAGTRKMKIQIDVHNPDTRNTETYVDGYVDNIQFKLVNPQSDLSVENLSTSNSPINATQEVTMAVTVRNGGSQGYAPSTATLTIDNLPSGVSLQRSQPSICVQIGAQVTCSLNSLDYGDAQTIDFSFTTNESTFGTFNTITASVQGQYTDPDASNNSATFPALTIQPYADLQVQVSAPKAVTKPPGAVFSYDAQITITNTGPSLAQGVVLTATLPSNTSVVAPPSGCSTAANQVSCNIGSLGVNQTVQRTLTFEVNPLVAAGTSLEFTAGVSGQGEDPAPNSNTAGPFRTLVTYWDTDIGAQGPGGSVQALIFLNNVLYAGGAFGVKKWAGGTWSNVGSLSGTVYALAAVGNTLYAGGSFGVKRWTGSTWEAESGPTGTVRAFAVSGSTLYAGGDNGVWQKSSPWTALGSLGNVKALAVYNSTLFAGGSFGVKQWTGSTWEVVPGLSGPVNALLATGPDLYAGGSFFGALARYDGRVWYPMPNISGTVYALAANGPEIFVGGNFVRAGGISGANYVARWNGINGWSALSDGTDTTVRAVTLAGGSVYVGGDFTTVDGVDVAANSVGRWAFPSVNLSLTKTATPSTIFRGQTVTYTLTIRNAGGGQASQIALRDTLPSDFTLISVSSPACTPQNTTILCENLGSLGAGQQMAIQIQARSPWDTGTFENSAVVTSLQPEIAHGADNIAKATVNVGQRVADLVVTKSAPSTVGQGRRLAYALRVKNAGPDDALGVVLTDTLPFGVTFLGASLSSPVCDESRGNVVCHLGDLAPGDVVGIYISVEVNAIPGTQLRNTAVATSLSRDPNSKNSRGSATTTVIAYADLSLSKRAPSTVKAGTSLAYTLLAGNAGPNDASNTTVVDTLPADVLFNSSQSDPRCSAQGSRVTCDLATLSQGQSTELTIVVDVPATLAAGTVLTNTAQIMSDARENNAGDESDTVSTTVYTEADLLLTKSAPNSALAGQSIPYTLTVLNQGPSPAADIVLTDVLPAEVTFVAANPSQGTCSYQAGNHRVVCALGLLSASAQTTVSVEVNIPANLSSGTVLTNQADVTSSVNDPTSNTVATSTNVQAQADLSLTKTATPDVVRAGERITYVLALGNAGPAQAKNVQLVDYLPRDVVFLSAVSPTGTCAYDASVHRVVCDWNALDVGAGGDVTVVVDTPPTLADGTRLVNTAQVAADSTDPTPNSAAVTTTVTTAADLALTKRASPDPVVAGAQLVYTLTVTNLGPSRAADVTLTDNLPSGTTFFLVTPDNPTCTYSNGDITCRLGDLSRGEQRHITIMVQVDNDVPGGSLSNTATVTSATTDPDSTNNDASTSTAVHLSADLEAHKRAPAQVFIADRILYYLSVTNLGPSNVSHVVLTDTLPAGTQFISASPSCTYDTGTVTCNVGSLAANTTSETYTLTVALDDTLPNDTLLTNQVLATSNVPDPSTANNTASASTTVTTNPANLHADLALTKSAPATVYAWGEFTYTLQVENKGALDATAVTVTDTLPAEVVFVSASSPQGACTYDSAQARVTCTLGDLKNGEQAHIYLAVQVASQYAGQSLLNQAVVAAITPDWEQQNNTATATTTVTPAADLEVHKAAPATALAGESITYHVTVANAGPNDASGVILTDTLPAQVTLLSVTPAQGTCTTDARQYQFTCALGPLPFNSDTTVTVTVAIPSDTPAGTTLVNSAEVTSNAHETAPATNKDDVVTTVQTAADLTLTKRVSPDPVIAGTQLAYTLTVTNLGPSRATGVQVTDNLPAGVSFVSTNPDGLICMHSGEESGGTVTCNLGDMAPNSQRDIVVIVRVHDSLSDHTTLTNQARVDSDVLDPSPENNAGTADASVRTEADLEAHKTAPDEIFVRGRLVYELTVTNNGPSQAINVQMRDPLPSQAVFEGASLGCAYNSGMVTCNVGDLAVGETSAVYTISVTFDPALTQDTQVQNTVQVLADTQDANTANNSATAVTLVTVDPTPYHADMAVTKGGPSQVNAGEKLFYTLQVANRGGLDATHIVVTDTLPAGTTFNASLSNTQCKANSGVVVCTIDALAAGAFRYLSIVVETDPWQAAASEYVNTATVVADQPDWTPANNTDDVRTVVARSADLTISKAGSTSIALGEPVYYTITVQNRGPSAAAGVRVVDTLPTEIATAIITPSLGTCTVAPPTLTCDLGDMAPQQEATITLHGVPGSAGSITNSATVSATTPDPDPSNNAASTDTEVMTTGPQTRTIGRLTVTANAFVDLGGNRVQALGDIRLGTYYRQEGTTLILDYNDNSLTGEGRLILNTGAIALFDGAFTASGDTGVLIPDASATTVLWRVAGFAVHSANISQVNLLSGETTARAALNVQPPGMNARVTANVTLGTGPTFAGTIENFTFTLAASTLRVTNAVLNDGGITINAATLTLPARFGGNTSSLSGMIIAPDSIYMRDGTIPLPDIVFGPHLRITEMQGTFVVAFGAIVLQASGQVEVNIPGNVERVPTRNLYLNAQGDLSGSVEWLQLKVSGGRLDMKSLQVNNAGLLAPAAQWWLPENFSGSGDKVYLTDLPITGDGLNLSVTPTLLLPDVRLGNKVTFADMRGRLTKDANGITMAITGTLKLSLPQNSDNVPFTAQLDTQGNFRGTLEELTLQLAAVTIKLTKVGLTNTSLSAKQGTLTLPKQMGGVSGIVNNVKIDKSGLSIGGGGVGIPLPDFTMASGVFSVTESTLTFEIAADRTYKVSIAGTLHLAVKNLQAEATAIVGLDSRGNVSGVIKSLSIQVAGLGLALENVAIDNTGFFASKAALEIPPAWGGLAAEVYNVRVNASGLTIGGGRFKIPDIKVGKVTLAGLEGSFIQVPGGYEIGAGGTFIIPSLGGGANCGISVRVTLFADGQGRTVARIEPAASTAPTLSELARAGNMHPANFTPEDAEAIQKLALRNVSVGLTGCRIPIGNTGLFLTRVEGSLTLNQGTTRIDMGVTVSGGPQVAGVYALSGDVNLGLQFNPFQMDLAGAISVFSIFKMAEMQATIRQDLFSATLHIVQIWPPVEGQASLTIWTSDGFHLVGSATLSFGFRRGAFGEVCVPLIGWPCALLPPIDLRLAEVGTEFGEFVSDDGTVWGMKAWVTLGIFELGLTFTVGMYFDASGTLAVGNVDEYQTVTPPILARARALWDDVQYGRRLTAQLSPEEREMLRTYAFVENDVYVAIPLAEPTDMFIMLSRVTERPGITLISPDGMEITASGQVENVGFEENLITANDGSGRTATQVTVVVKQAQPGTWRVKLSGPLTQDDLYVLRVNGVDPAPTLRDVRVTDMGGNQATVTWSLLSNDMNTNLNIYATRGPITTTQVVTTTEGTTKTIVIPYFNGVPIAVAVDTPLDGASTSLQVDLSGLESGVYYLWLDADDGRNPPVRAYATTTVQVSHPWQPTWAADTRVESAYRQVTLFWNRSANPDVDGYRLQVNTAPAPFAARGLGVSRALNTPPEIDVGDVVSYTLYNLAPDQPYYITVIAVDEDLGQTAMSEEITALPQGADFTLSANTTDLVLAGGQDTSFTVTVSTALSPYPSTVSLRLGDHPDGLLLEPETEVVTPTVAGVPVRVTVYSTRDVPGGTYTVNLVASGGGVEQILPVQVTVRQPEFALVATPDSVILNEGDTAHIVLSAQGMNGETRPVQLSLERDTFPAWLQYSLSASDLPIGGEVTLTITDTEQVQGGDYTLSLLGRIGEQTTQLDIPLTVNKPYVVVSTDMGRQVALPGETVTYTLNLTGQPAGTPVALSLSQSVPGSTWGFVTPSGDRLVPTRDVEIPGSADLVIHLPSGVTPGVHRLDVRASGDGWEYLLPLDLVVTNAATSADVGVQHSAFPEQIVGAQGMYTLTVTNYGPSTALDVVLTNTLDPEDVNLLEARVDQGTCTVQGNVLTCYLGDLDRNEQVDVVVSTHVPSTLPSGTVFSSEAVVRSATSDMDRANNEHSASVTAQTRADLSVTVTDVPPTATAGTVFRYRLMVRNNGPSDAREVTLFDTLPSQATLVSLQADTGTCRVSQGPVACDLGTQPAGASTSVIVDVAVDSRVDGTLLNVAQVESKEIDPIVENNDTRVETAVTHEANLEIEASVSPSPAVAGRDLTYTFLLANRGPSDASDVVLTTVLPAGVTFASGTPRNCSGSGATVTCALGRIASAQQQLVALTVQIGPEYTGALVAQAQVSSAAHDPSEDNNATSTSVDVTSLADLALTLVEEADPVRAGEALEYTLLVTNTGPSTAQDIVAQMTFPTDLDVLSVTPEKGTCETNDGAITCNVGSLGPNGETGIRLSLDTRWLIRGARARVTATVTTRTPDTNAGNNTDQALTTITASEASRLYLPVMQR